MNFDFRKLKPGAPVLANGTPATYVGESRTGSAVVQREDRLEPSMYPNLAPVPVPVFEAVLPCFLKAPG